MYYTGDNVGSYKVDGFQVEDLPVRPLMSNDTSCVKSDREVLNLARQSS
ncbi:MAG: hypothetical protein ACJATN_002129 [Neolewinella sp.]|jgi:hypothetical protein